jgi:hypothetical protein
MATSKAKMLTIVGRCRRVGWEVEDAEGTRAEWAYRITTPKGKRVQIHRSPSDGNWEKVVLRQLDEDDLLTTAEAEWEQRNATRKTELKSANDARNKIALERAHKQSLALLKASGPVGTTEADLGWLLTPTSRPETRTVIITPEAAQKILETANTYNRPKRDERINEFVAIIENGEWGVTHQGAAINSDGILQDGQHRLEAIALTGKPQIIQISVGMPPDNFTKVDTPLMRRARDAAAMRGEVNVLTLTAAARLIILFDRLGPDLHLKGNRLKVSIDAVDRATREWGDDLRNAVARSHRLRRELKITATALAAAIFLIRRRLPPGDPRAEAFFADLETGVNIEQYDAAWLLRRHFIRGQANLGRPSQYSALAYIIKAWNLRASGRSASVLVWRSNEAFPSTIILPPREGDPTGEEDRLAS